MSKLAFALGMIALFSLPYVIAAGHKLWAIAAVLN